MTPRDMQDSFEHKLNIMDSPMMVESHIVFYWLNQAVEHFIRNTILGNNARRNSVEQSQKQTENVRTLIVENSITPTTGGVEDKPDSYIVTLPSNYNYVLSEEVSIEVTNLKGDIVTIRQGITETTSDQYRNDIDNPYSEHKLHYDTAKPLRLFKEDSIELITDGNYTINKYFLRYIRKPEKISLGGIDCELPEFVHSEIVDLAVRLFVGSIGDPRYSQESEQSDNNN